MAKPRREDALVTVIIPVKNGGERLKECLTAVFAQRAPFAFEVLCVDSGSTDHSVALLRSFPCRVLEIAPRDFGHGKTRNWAIAQTRTPYVAMLTQDAVPADASWLEELIAPLQDNENVAGVFGRHVPHPECNPSEAAALQELFERLEAAGSVYAIAPTPEGIAQYESNKSFYRFFSDNNAALRRSVWEGLPYPEVDFMEDQLWGAAALEAGYAKAYAPRAVVRHSHDYPALTVLRRTFDEARYLRHYFDPKGALLLRSQLKQRLQEALLDAKRRQGRQLPQTLAHHLARAVGMYLGDHAEVLPEAWVRRISQHHSLRGDEAEAPALGEELKQAWRLHLQELGKGAGPALLAARGVRDALLRYREARETQKLPRHLALSRLLHPPAPPSKAWWAQGPYPYLGEAPPTELNRASRSHAADPQHLVINWVVPAYGRGAGGHMTLFRIVQHLERFGHRCRIYIQDGLPGLPREGVKMHQEINAWFVPIQAPVRHLGAEMEDADICVATSWQTAYAVQASQCARAKAYFIQDHEPSFHPMGTEHQLAEDTYQFPFHPITAGTWLAQLMRERGHAQASSFSLAVDHKAYWREEVKRDAGPQRVFAYVRPHTPRRAFELVGMALQLLLERKPDLEIHIAGSELDSDALPVPFVSHGILQPPELRKLFASVDVALCVSLTNYSLMPQELMACGCPVVDVDGANTRGVYAPGTVTLAPPTAKGLAEGLASLLEDEPRRQQQIQRGLEHVATLSWEDSARAVERGLQTCVEKAAPRVTARAVRKPRRSR